MADDRHPRSRVIEYEDVEAEEHELLKRLSIAALLLEETLFGEANKRKRGGSERRGRERVERAVDGWTDATFRRQLRMTRSSFAKLRDAVDHKSPPGDSSEEAARQSSGSTASASVRL